MPQRYSWASCENSNSDVSSTSVDEACKKKSSEPARIFSAPGLSRARKFGRVADIAQPLRSLPCNVRSGGKFAAGLGQSQCRGNGLAANCYRSGDQQPRKKFCTVARSSPSQPALREQPYHQCLPGTSSACTQKIDHGSEPEDLEAHNYQRLRIEDIDGQGTKSASFAHGMQLPLQVSDDEDVTIVLESEVIQRSVSRLGKISLLLVQNLTYF